MDPVSHALTGAALGMLLAPAGRVRTAGFVGAVIAVIPDLDVLIRDSSDPLFNVEFHRHFSHALLTSVLLGLLAAGAAALRTATAWRTWLAPMVAAALSAPLLDACTSYGVHLLWPFAEGRIAWSIIAVVDPLYTVPLLAFCVVALWRSNRLLAASALALGAVYLTVGFVQQQRVDWAMRTLAAERGHTVERSIAKPTIGNVLLWRTLYVADGQVHADAVRAGLGLQIYPGVAAPLVKPTDLDLPPGSVLATDLLRMHRLSQAYLVRHPTRKDVYGDARFAMQPDSIEPMFGISVDTEAADRHAPYVELRAFGPDALRRFKAMLKGEALPRIHSPEAQPAA